MTTRFYFAYGSNMLHERLVKRVSSAQLVGAAVLPCHRMDFGKISTDGSGKCDVIADEHGLTLGVIYEVDEAQLGALDAEEAGYERKILTSRSGQREMPVIVYAARQEKRGGGVPYDWYLALLIAGAEQNRLGADYVQFLYGLAFDIDLDTGRKSRSKALDVLAAAGMSHVLDNLRRKQRNRRQS